VIERDDSQGDPNGFEALKKITPVQPGPSQGQRRFGALIAAMRGGPDGVCK
jgi:hypothetical protein